LLLSRQALRGLLLARLNPGTVRWGCVLAAVEVLGSADDGGDDGASGNGNGEGGSNGGGNGGGGGGGFPATRRSGCPAEPLFRPSSPETRRRGHAAPLRLWAQAASPNAGPGAPAADAAEGAGAATGALTLLPFHVAVLVGADGLRSGVRGLLDRVAGGAALAHGTAHAAAQHAATRASAVRDAPVVAHGRTDGDGGADGGGSDAAIGDARAALAPAAEATADKGGVGDPSHGRFFAAGGSSEAGLVYLGVVCVLGIVAANDYRLAATATDKPDHPCGSRGTAADEADAWADPAAATCADKAGDGGAAPKTNARAATAGLGVEISETVDGETRLYRMPFSRGAHNGKTKCVGRRHNGRGREVGRWGLEPPCARK
jgi:hypothetical protein